MQGSDAPGPGADAPAIRDCPSLGRGRQDSLRGQGAEIKRARAGAASARRKVAWPPARRTIRKLTRLAPGTAGRARRVISWSALGFVAALGRFATISLIALAVQPPALVYAVLLPGLLVHGIFGILSGLVTAPLLAALPALDQPPESS